MAVPQILGPDGQPIRREVLTTEVARPTLSGVRSVLSGYPADGLTPGRVAMILREADQGVPLRYLELAEIVEERDLHYLGVLGTRKRSVAQLEITVEAASDDAIDVEKANRVREWLKRDELQQELFDILDAIGKGVSFTEIVWDTSAGQWEPERLEWRDPRWFTFDRIDGRTPLLRTDTGDVPLDPFKYVRAVIAAKSGLPIRSGLARLACWGWMFKSFTLRDWAIFTQTYGQPIRVGKYESSATGPERDVLFDAVANIAGDCAAIIPQSMTIEFVELKAAASNADIYKARADWLDQQISKGVLGQTATTDAIAGGHAVGQEHRQVQEDIERADAKALSAILNRDLVRPWMDLDYGPGGPYPRLRVGRQDVKDITATSTALKDLVPMGLRVQTSDVRDMLGFPDPDAGAEVLVAPAVAAPALTGPGGPGAPAIAGELPPALQAAFDAASTQDAIDTSIEAILADQGWERMVAPMIEGLDHKLAACSSIDEARDVLARHLATMDVGALAETLARAAFASRLTGETGQALSDKV
ncbi:DUF935 domain-containing protein [Methylobacterium sp. WL6]|uniref:DUF935 domain-containing protein n=1 Tax=Methylobacterium sp. WL6 TaxID=2603901 RepID=UPI0011CB0C6F|nr:DUF935 domain-containing protein [Methylobacterium sp. WL6]TXN71644.1 DUF935 domain-containing protein [Methylobacterium sp. WL6]